VTTDLNTLLAALYVKIDDHLGRPVWVGRVRAEKYVRAGQ